MCLSVSAPLPLFLLMCPSFSIVLALTLALCFCLLLSIFFTPPRSLVSVPLSSVFVCFHPLGCIRAHSSTFVQQKARSFRTKGTALPPNCTAFAQAKALSSRALGVPAFRENRPLPEVDRVSESKSNTAQIRWAGQPSYRFAQWKAHTPEIEEPFWHSGKKGTAFAQRKALSNTAHERSR